MDGPVHLPPLTEQALESMRRMGVDVDLLFGGSQYVPQHHPMVQQGMRSDYTASALSSSASASSASTVRGYTPTYGGISGYDGGPTVLGTNPNGYLVADTSSRVYPQHTQRQPLLYSPPRQGQYSGDSIVGYDHQASPYSPSSSSSTFSIQPQAIFQSPPTNMHQSYQSQYVNGHTNTANNYSPSSTLQGYLPSTSTAGNQNSPVSFDTSFYPDPSSPLNKGNVIGNGNGHMSSPPISRQPQLGEIGSIPLFPSSHVAPSKREPELVGSSYRPGGANAGSRPYPAPGPAPLATGPSGKKVDGNGSGKKEKSKDREEDRSGMGDAQGGSSNANASGKGALAPVKNACLSCRAKKARCDGGQPICSQCITKERECVYVKSKRGGARKRREKPPPEAPTALASFLQQLDHVMMFQPPPKGIDGLSLGEKSAAATKFEHVQVTKEVDENDVEGVLRFYWTELHPLHPLLPPVKHIKLISSRLKPDSPFLLAIRCILALIPTSEDPELRSLAAKAVRRHAASSLADKAVKRVQDMVAAAKKDGMSPSIECAQALSLLGLYEFGQTNDAKKNWDRMSQALELATELGLHQLDRAAPFVEVEEASYKDIAVDDHEEVMREMGRRTFWVIYQATMLASLLALKTTALRARDKRITSRLPTCYFSDSAWLNWIEGMCMTVDATNIILTLDYGLPYETANEDLKEEFDPEFELECVGHTEEQRAAALLKRRLHRKLVDIDTKVLLALKAADDTDIHPLTSDGEEEVVRNHELVTLMLLANCQVQIHRRQAFPEVALFGREMCGLPQPPTNLLTESRAGGSQSPTSAITSGEYAHSRGHRGSGSSAEYGSSDYAAGSVDGLDQAALQSPLNGYNPPGTTDDHSLSGIAVDDFGFGDDFGGDSSLPMAGLLWDPTIYPESFPTPWFANPSGAGAFYQPLLQAPAYLPPVDGLYSPESGWIGAPLNGQSLGGWNPTVAAPAPSSAGLAGYNIVDPSSKALTSITPAQLGYRLAPEPQQVVDATAAWSADALASYRLPPARPPMAWGADARHRFYEEGPSRATMEASSSPGDVLDIGDDGVENIPPVSMGPDGPFPPGLSLQRCATAAHSIVRLQVLHRSAKLTLTQYPRLVPWCSCALVSGAYSFLLLCLAIQASNTFDAADPASQREIHAMWNNVQVILAGLEAYGQVWDGIDMMAAEVKAALEAAKQLPQELAMSVRSGSTARV